MNTKKILLSVLICLVMVATLCLTVACNHETKVDLSDAENWGAGVAAEEGMNIYVPSNDKDGNLVLDFEKNDTYNATRIMFAHFSLDDLAKAKTLVITAKMTTDNPRPSMIFKVEGTAMREDGTKWENAEVHVKGTTDYTTYEWDFEGYDLTKVTRFLIMADAGVHSTKGTITIKEIYLTSKDVTPENDAHNKPVEAGKAPDPVWNEVTATNMSIGKWVDGTANNVYTVTAEGTSSKVDVHKNAGAGQWDGLVSYVYGDALATAKTFKLVVKGTKDKQIWIKPFDSFETKITLTGEDQVITIDVSTFTADTAKDYSKDTITAENKVIIMGLPNVVRGTDTFTIISAEFSTETVGNPNLNTIAGATKAITKWYAEDAYTLEVKDGAVKATIGKNDSWAQLKADVAGAGVASYDVLNVKLTGVKNVPFVVKGWDGKEYCYDGRPDGAIPTTDEVTVPVAVPAGDYSITKTLIIFLNVNDNKLNTCTVTISAEFARTATTITAENKKVTKWYDNDANGDYTVVTKEDGSVEVSKSAAGWQQLKADVAGAALANMKTFRMTIKGINGENIIVKPYDKVEAKYEPAAQDEITIIIDLTKAVDVNYDGTLSILIFYQFGDNNPAASFTIVSAEFSTEAAPAA